MVVSFSSMTGSYGRVLSLGDTTGTNDAFTTSKFSITAYNDLSKVNVIFDLILFILKKSCHPFGVDLRSCVVSHIFISKECLNLVEA